MLCPTGCQPVAPCTHPIPAVFDPTQTRRSSTTWSTCTCVPARPPCPCQVRPSRAARPRAASRRVQYVRLRPASRRHTPLHGPPACRRAPTHPGPASPVPMPLPAGLDIAVPTATARLRHTFRVRLAYCCFCGPADGIATLKSRAAPFGACLNIIDEFDEGPGSAPLLAALPHH